MKAEEECQMITKSPWTSPSHSQKHLPPSLLSAPLSVSTATASIASTSRAQASAQSCEMQLLTTAEGLQSDLLLTGMHSDVMNMTTLPCTLYMSFLRTFKLHLDSSLKICLFFLCAWKGITYKSVKALKWSSQISPWEIEEETHYWLGLKLGMELALGFGLELEVG